MILLDMECRKYISFSEFSMNVAVAWAAPYINKWKSLKKLLNLWTRGLEDVWTHLL